MSKKDKKNRQSGFTLIEIMIVLAIVGILFSFVGVGVMKQFKKAKIDSAKIQIASFEQGLQAYYLAHNYYPSTAQTLEALVKKPSVGKVPDNWQGPYLSKNSVPKDPFGNPYRYTSDNQQEYKITSDGPDGEPGNDDDISSDAASN